jgi:hypothetical protein
LDIPHSALDLPRRPPRPLESLFGAHPSRRHLINNLNRGLYLHRLRTLSHYPLQGTSPLPIIRSHPQLPPAPSRAQLPTRHIRHRSTNSRCTLDASVVRLETPPNSSNPQSRQSSSLSLSQSSILSALYPKTRSSHHPVYHSPPPFQSLPSLVLPRPCLASLYLSSLTHHRPSSSSHPNHHHHLPTPSLAPTHNAHIVTRTRAYYTDTHTLPTRTPTHAINTHALAPQLEPPSTIPLLSSLAPPHRRITHAITTGPLPHPSSRRIRIRTNLRSRGRRTRPPPSSCTTASRLFTCPVFRLKACSLTLPSPWSTTLGALEFGP